MSPDARVCVVTGASRGIGKGLALALCEAGHTVYITGRTLHASDRKSAKGGSEFGSLAETAEECSARGGRCHAVQVDHNDDTQVEALFRRIDAEQGQGRLDLLVNNAFAGAVDGIKHGMMATGQGWWDKPLKLWEQNFGVGLVRRHV